MTEAARYLFNAADAIRALGMPDDGALQGSHVCIIVAKTGSVFINIGDTAEDAELLARKEFEDFEGYAEARQKLLSEPLQTAIRLEAAGLPMGRTDVNPTNVPALAVAPDDFTQARTAKVPMADGLVEPEDVAKAWKSVQAQAAAAEPPFPAALKGYTFTPDFEIVGDDTISGSATLTVYG
jgi:hypothetical protein